jgi:hypothetical protein
MPNTMGREWKQATLFFAYDCTNNTIKTHHQEVFKWKRKARGGREGGREGGT